MKIPNEHNIKSESQFTISFRGENKIDALVLSKAIENVARLTMFAATEFPETNINTKVHALKSGSFEILFLAICESPHTLMFTLPEIVKRAKTTIDIVKRYFDIIKHLGGEKPKNISKQENNIIEIENPSGQKIRVPQGSAPIINNITIYECASKVAECASMNNASEGFLIKTEDGDTEYSSDDIKKMTVPFIVDNNDESIEKNVIITKLLIRAPDLLQKASWQFWYKGKTIKAKIRDEYFLDNVNAGLIEMKKGSYIKAKLEITTGLDETTPKYAINEVIGGIIHNEVNLEQLTTFNCD